MMQVADHLHGTGGVEDVIRGLPKSISDAMFTMIENMEPVKNKVRAHFDTEHSWQVDKKKKVLCFCVLSSDLCLPTLHNPTFILWRQRISEILDSQ